MSAASPSESGHADSEQRPAYVPLSELNWSGGSAALLSRDFALERRLAPLRASWPWLVLVGDTRKDDTVITAAESLAGMPVQVLRTSSSELEIVLRSIYDLEPDGQSAARLQEHLKAITNEDAAAADDISLDLEARAFTMGTPWLAIQDWRLPGAAARTLGLDTIEADRVVPLARIGNQLIVATDRPPTGAVSRRVAGESGLEPRFCLTDPGSMDTALALVQESLQAYEELPEVDIVNTLAERGELNSIDAAQALEAANLGSSGPIDVLVEWGVIDQDTADGLLARFYETEAIDLDRTVPTPDALSRVPAELAWRVNALPFQIHRGRLRCATHNPTNPETVIALQAETGLDVELLHAPVDAVTAAIEAAYPGLADSPAAGEFIAAFLVQSGVAAYGDDSIATVDADGAVGNAAAARALAVHLGLTCVQPERWRIDRLATTALPEALARDLNLAPLEAEAGLLTVVGARELAADEVRRLQQAAGRGIRQVLAPAEATRQHREGSYQLLDTAVEPQALALVERLVDRRLIPNYAFEGAQAVAGDYGGRLDEALCATTDLDPDVLARTAAEFMEVPYLPLGYQRNERTIIDAIGREITEALYEDPVDSGAARLISGDEARRLSALPVGRVNGAVQVAVADPFRPHLAVELGRIIDDPVQLGITPRPDFTEAMRRHTVGESIGDLLVQSRRLTPGQLA